MPFTFMILDGGGHSTFVIFTSESTDFVVNPQRFFQSGEFRLSWYLKGLSTRLMHKSLTRKIGKCDIKSSCDIEESLFLLQLLTSAMQYHQETLQTNKKLLAIQLRCAEI